VFPIASTTESLTENDDLPLDLTEDEGLVLYEILSRYVTCDSLTIEHPAEQQVLWNLQCLLEKLGPVDGHGLLVVWG
jgi:hypothetical protein